MHQCEEQASPHGTPDEPERQSALRPAQGLIILVLEVTGTSFELSKRSLRRFLKSVWMLALCSQMPVTLRMKGCRALIGDLHPLKAVL